jgi:hypothetical protein
MDTTTITTYHSERLLIDAEAEGGDMDAQAIRAGFGERWYHEGIQTFQVDKLTAEGFNQLMNEINIYQEY